MLHIPVRGVFMLSRAALMLAAAAAVPIVLKSAKPVAKRMGEELEKFGKWMQEETEAIKTTAEAKPKTEEKANGSNGKVAKRPAQTEAKKPTSTKRTTRSRPKPKPKTPPSA